MKKTSPKPFVFVLMPFSEEFDDVYKLGIKPACENVGAYAERVDEQLFKETILQRIYNQIAKADIVVSEMTGRNANVFYETGYAHALGKNVILLTQKSEDIPFDLKHYPHIVYGRKISDLIPEIEKKVKWAIENPEEAIPPPEAPIRFFIDGISLSINPTIECPVLDKESESIDLQIDANNSPEKIVKTLTFQVAFHTTDRLGVRLRDDSFLTDYVKAPQGGYIHILRKDFSIMPGSWESIFIRIHPLGDPFCVNEEESITLSLFSDIGAMNYPFKISTVPIEAK